jgi:hypothetical protein
VPAVKLPLGVLWYGDGPDYGFWKEKDYGTGVKPQRRRPGRADTACGLTTGIRPALLRLRAERSGEILFEDAVLTDRCEIFGEIGWRLDGRPELFGAQVANHVAGHVVGCG